MSPPRRRDRRGRGLRGRLLVPLVQVGDAAVRVPSWRSRTEAFDGLVGAAVAGLEGRWGAELAGVEFVVEDVPHDLSPLEDGVVRDETVPLGRLRRADGTQPARVVVYRRPLEARADGRTDLEQLVHEVLLDLVADLLGLDPDVIDPSGP